MVSSLRSSLILSILRERGISLVDQPISDDYTLTGTKTQIPNGELSKFGVWLTTPAYGTSLAQPGISLCLGLG
jgi:hypothetical protein